MTATATLLPPVKPARKGREAALARIRAAAITEFALHGLKGASTQAIAARAGMTKAQLHYYILGKEELYEELLQSVLNAWAGAATFDEHSGDPRTALANYIRAKLEYSFAFPELSRIFTREVLSGGPYLKKYWPQASASAHRKVAAIERWIAQKLMPPLDARMFLMHIWTVTQHYADYGPQIALMFGGVGSPSLPHEHIVDEVTRFILCGCGLGSEAG
ncbi:MAG: TetR/AcrR family transcriptional regulator [Pigmentiphaga sp.]|uniref:TetR/AcrR family transcriptional regulator n=1 Tax=Pigmentiphaga sp. TaxID=1977564 RepID=UPI0029B65D89|nr:TetR/AcrR family transcriptional regulator [Pigmentiphaga sp.]MDX3906117.1 TetR/AcrR family transcriptional regulator [Pigmentiphaga sp.]